MRAGPSCKRCHGHGRHYPGGSKEIDRQLTGTGQRVKKLDGSFNSQRGAPADNQVAGGPDALLRARGSAVDPTHSRAHSWANGDHYTFNMPAVHAEAVAATGAKAA